MLASQFINEQYALVAGLPKEQMAREIFPKSHLKYMPPTKFMTGDIFKGQVQDALFNMVTIITNQKLHLLEMLTEAIHTPFISDRALPIENAQYIFNTMSYFSEEIEFRLVSQPVTQKNIHIENLTNLVELLEAEGLRDKVILMFGGHRITHELAK